MDVFTVFAAGWCCLCERVHIKVEEESVCVCVRERARKASVGLTVQTSQSLPTRRLPCRPETALAPEFHTPTCHILRLPHSHFADTLYLEDMHAHSILNYRTKLP